MAKIIDFKTRQVLADFPKDVISPRPHAFLNRDIGNGYKFYIIAYNGDQAVKTSKKIQTLLQLDKAIDDQKKVG